LRRRRPSSIAADSAARHILFGGGVAHSRLAAAEIGGSGVYYSSIYASEFWSLEDDFL